MAVLAGLVILGGALGVALFGKEGERSGEDIKARSEACYLQYNTNEYEEGSIFDISREWAFDECLRKASGD